MRKFIPVLLFISIFIVFLVSCSNQRGNVVEYPDIYTTEYCTANYIEADPNLLYTVSADNCIGQIDVPGGYASYYAIKDVPLDEYLLLDESIMFAPFSYQIVKNKNNTNLPQQEILSYEIKSIIIYTRSSDIDVLDKRALGDKMIGEIIASVDHNDTSAFQDNIIDCLANNDYVIAGQAGGTWYDEDPRAISLRVIFEGYENLVWDSGISKQNGTYYIVFYMINEMNGGWRQIWLPLNQELAELIP